MKIQTIHTGVAPIPSQTISVFFTKKRVFSGSFTKKVGYKRGFLYKSEFKRVFFLTKASFLHKK